MKKLLLILTLFLIVSSVSASVNTINSGIFRGSLRNIVTFDEPQVYVEGVASGDYISVKFPDKEYVYNGYERKSIYIRRIDGEKVTYDFDIDKFNDILPGDIITFEIDDNTFMMKYLESNDRKGDFLLYLENSTEEPLIMNENTTETEMNITESEINITSEPKINVTEPEVNITPKIETNITETEINKTIKEPEIKEPIESKKSFWQWLFGWLW